MSPTIVTPANIRAVYANLLSAAKRAAQHQATSGYPKISGRWLGVAAMANAALMDDAAKYDYLLQLVTQAESEARG